MTVMTAPAPPRELLPRGRYVTVGASEGDEALRLARPFPVTLVAADLVLDPSSPV